MITEPVVVAKLAHTLTKTDAKEATCGTAGNNAYWTCTVCGKVFSDEAGTTETTVEAQALPANGTHTLTKTDAKDATCAAVGNNAYWTCSVCGKVFRDEAGTTETTIEAQVLPANGTHTLTPVEAKASTCGAAGNNAYWTCSVCGKVFSDEAGTTETTVEAQTLPLAPHALTPVGAVESTCTTNGNSAHWKCTVCGKLFSDEAGTTETTQEAVTIAKIAHTLTPVEAKAATCGAAGNNAYWTCSVCEKVFSDEAGTTETTVEAQTIAATGAHTLVEVEAVAPTAETEGAKAHWKCSVCGKLFSDAEGKTEIAAPEVIPVLATYTVTWRNESNTENPVLKVDEKVVVGTVPAYTGETVPAKAADPNNTYAFSGWNYEPALDANGGITGDTVATAQFAAVQKIKAFDMAGGVYSMTYKPDLATAQQLCALPAEMDVTLSDESKAKVGVVWNYDSYAAHEGDGDYVFTAALADGTRALMDGVAMPTFTFHVGPATSADGACTYRLNPAGELTIEKWNAVPETGAVTVVSPLDGHPVVAVGPGAFQGLATMTVLDLPAGVRTLGVAAFADCPALTTLVLPDSLEMPALPENLTLNDAALVNLVLRTDLPSTLTAVDTVERDVPVAPVDGQEMPPEHKVLKLPLAVTDIIVNSNTLTQNCGFTVAAGHALTVNAGATLNVGTGATLIDLGTVTNNGTINYWGTVTNCAGAWVGAVPVPQEGGVFHSEHQYSDGKCVVCGAEDPNQVTEITASYVGSGLEKVYDGTRNVALKGSDLKLNGVRDGHDVKIVSPLQAEYDKADAGERTVTITITLGGNDAKRYTIKPFTVNTRISPLTMTLTPYEGQKKTYGAKDPTTFGCGVKPIPPDKATGRLTREQGENVGKYKILLGTIKFGSNDANYTINMADVYFTIEPKSINSSDIGLVTIGNQRYTGQPITPDVTLRFGSQTLVKDTDFNVTYSNNTQPGDAKVKITGMGNYTGERETTFKILNVANGSTSGGTSGGGSSSGGGSYSDGSFDDGEEESDEDFEDEIDPNTGKLFLKDPETGEEVDYGTILFRATGEPAPFVQFVELIEPEQAEGEDEAGQLDGEPKPEQWALRIIPDPLEDEETEETLYLDEAAEREKYDELHLRLSQSLLNTLTQKGFTEIIYEFEKAEVRIPIASLKPEIPLTPVQPPMDDDELELVQETESLNAEDGAQSETIKVAIYDVCVEQVENLELTDREKDQLILYKPVTGAYRVRVGIITEGEAALLADAAQTTSVEDATELTLSPADELPAGRYPEGIRLLFAPLDDDLTDDEEATEISGIATEAEAEEEETDEDEDSEDAEDEDAEDEDAEDEEEEDEEEDEVLASAPKDALTLYMSYYPTQTDENGNVIDPAQAPQTAQGAEGQADGMIPATRDVVEINPTTFVNEEGMLYAEILPTADGIYAVGVPKTDEELAADLAARAAAGDEDAEGEFEDLGGASTGFAGTSFGMGASFSVDENGNAVFNN
ncbi:MAG: Ig-like domain-containing protein [Clostridia bacterium]|nr:Ig-like domain-containing protein [Clostridia bacterium]